MVFRRTSLKFSQFNTLIMQRARRLNKEREEYYQGSEEDINANAGVYRYGRRAKLVHGSRFGRGPYYQYQTLSYHSPLMQQQQQKPDRRLQKRSTFERTLVERGYKPPPTPRHIAGSSLPAPVPQNVRDQIVRAWRCETCCFETLLSCLAAFNH